MRITARDVLYAYLITGLRPVRGRWLTRHGYSGEWTLTAVAKALGLDLDYVRGWAEAWDQGPRPSDFLLTRAAFQAGYRDGAEAADLIFRLDEAAAKVMVEEGV